MNVKCKRGEISRERLPTLTLIERDKQAGGFQALRGRLPTSRGGRLENVALRVGEGGFGTHSTPPLEPR